MKGFKEIIASAPVSGDDMEQEPACIMIDSKQMPEVSGWKPGKEYKITVRMVSKEEDDKGLVRGEFHLANGNKKDQSASEPTDQGNDITSEE